MLRQPDSGHEFLAQAWLLAQMLLKVGQGERNKVRVCVFTATSAYSTRRGKMGRSWADVSWLGREEGTLESRGR